MIPIERFNEIVEEELKLLPEYVFEELNGGVLVDEKINLHPDRLADDLYIMGTYSNSPIMGKQIVIYYGSFTKTMPYADEETLRLKIRDTLRHEFRHHMETRAGFFGKGTLIDEDKQEMDRYFLMHAKREEAAATESFVTPMVADNSSPSAEQTGASAYKPTESESFGDIKMSPDEAEKTQENNKDTYFIKEEKTSFIDTLEQKEISEKDDNKAIETSSGFSGVKFVEGK